MATVLQCAWRTDAPMNLYVMLALRTPAAPNPFPACLAVQNKIVAIERMRAAGIPTPRSWVTSDPNLVRSMVEEHPVVIKPYNGGRGIGVRVVRDPHELAKAPQPTDPVVIQEYS